MKTKALNILTKDLFKQVSVNEARNPNHDEINNALWQYAYGSIFSGRGLSYDERERFEKILTKYRIENNGRYHQGLSMAFTYRPEETDSNFYPERVVFELNKVQEGRIGYFPEERSFENFKRIVLIRLPNDKMVAGPDFKPLHDTDTKKYIARHADARVTDVGDVDIYALLLKYNSKEVQQASRQTKQNQLDNSQPASHELYKQSKDLELDIKKYKEQAKNAGYREKSDKDRAQEDLIEAKNSYAKQIGYTIITDALDEFENRQYELSRQWLIKNTKEQGERPYRYAFNKGYYPAFVYQSSEQPFPNIYWKDEKQNAEAGILIVDVSALYGERRYLISRGKPSNWHGDAVPVTRTEAFAKLNQFYKENRITKASMEKLAQFIREAKYEIKET